jgi:hypothetical protein
MLHQQRRSNCIDRERLRHVFRLQVAPTALWHPPRLVQKPRGIDHEARFDRTERRRGGGDRGLHGQIQRRCRRSAEADYAHEGRRLPERFEKCRADRSRGTNDQRGSACGKACQREITLHWNDLSTRWSVAAPSAPPLDADSQPAARLAAVLFPGGGRPGTFGKLGPPHGH